MPVTPTFPGIYIDEIQSSAHTITAAPTSIAVFVGYTHPFKTKVFNKPVEIFSFSDYEREFGGFFSSLAFDAESSRFGDVAEAVNQFFLNGGSDAYVVGLKPQFNGTDIDPLKIQIGPLTFVPREITDDQHQLTVSISNLTSISSPPSSPPADDTCDVTITFGPPAKSPLEGLGVSVETYRQVNLNPTLSTGKPNPNYIGNQIGTAQKPVSGLVTVSVTGGGFLQNGTKSLPANPNPSNSSYTAGLPKIFKSSDFIKSAFEVNTGLDKVAIFNLLVVPGVTDSSVMAAASIFCERKRSFLIMDPPQRDSADGSGEPAPHAPDTVNSLPLIQETMEGVSPIGETIEKNKNAALFFPYLKSNDPVTGLANDPTAPTLQPYEIPPSGTVAGIFARTDLDRGVWKAPAGLETTLVNVTDVVDRGRMNDQRQGVLNQLGVNCIRNFPNIGPVVFGSRTSVSDNPSFQQWKYVPVRRMALFLEQTLYANLGWVVFEPNDEPLWTAIRNSIEAFMLGLFRQGAFQGDTPSQAFQVKCDAQTTTQADIDNGIVNIVVAFAPLKPAEFVIIKIAQLAGQTQTA
jgi:hypothetical protein